MQPPPLPGPAWYPDPTGQAGLRWWDGSRWTPHLSALPSETRPPANSNANAISISIGEQKRYLAGWWRRVGGLLLDSVFLSIPVTAGQLIVGGIFGSDPFPNGGYGAESTANLALRAIVEILSAVLVIAYPAYFMRTRGWTFGMRIAGVEVIDATTGQKLSRRQAWRRALFVFVVTGTWSRAEVILRFFNHHPNTTFGPGRIPTLIGELAALTISLWMLRSPINQTLQDKFAGSVVVLSQTERRANGTLSSQSTRSTGAGAASSVP